jgi:hypothetical protein
MGRENITKYSKSFIFEPTLSNQDKVRSELSTGPEGQVNTRIVIGKLPPRSRRKPARPAHPFPASQHAFPASQHAFPASQHAFTAPHPFPLALKKSDPEGGGTSGEALPKAKATSKRNGSSKRPKTSTTTTTTTAATTTTARPSPHSAEKLSFSSLISDFLPRNKN